MFHNQLIQEVQGLLREETSQSQTEKTILALRDTDYKDQTSYFKMVQLLKGLAAVSDKDKLANEYLSLVSDALTDIVESDDEDVDEEN
jgi:hypothetical protein